MEFARSARWSARQNRLPRCRFTLGITLTELVALLLALPSKFPLHRVVRRRQQQRQRPLDRVQPTELRSVNFGGDVGQQARPAQPLDNRPGLRRPGGLDARPAWHGRRRLGAHQVRKPVESQTQING